MNEIVELVKKTVAPVLGIPCGLKFALNQMKSPPWMGVPFKFAEFVDCAVHGSGGAAQLRLLGEKLIGIVLNPTNVAEPEKVKEPFRGPSGSVRSAKIALEEAVKEYESVRVNGVPDVGVAVTVQSIV